MKSNVFTYNNKTFRREVELLGEVEIIQWFEVEESYLSRLILDYSDREILDQDELSELEALYEASIIEQMMPITTII